MPSAAPAGRERISRLSPGCVLMLHVIEPSGSATPAGTVFTVIGQVLSWPLLRIMGLSVPPKVRPVTVWAVTVTVQVALLPPAVAVMVAVPALTAVTLPV